MPDFAMCADDACPQRDACLRFTAKPDTVQAYFAGRPAQGGECSYFMEVKAS